MDLGLKGRKAIITGSTRGIGRAIAEHLAAEGVDVAIGARDEAATKEAAEAIAAKYGCKVFGKAINVKDADAYKAWLTEAEKHWEAWIFSYLMSVAAAAWIPKRTGGAISK